MKSTVLILITGAVITCTSITANCQDTISLHGAIEYALKHRIEIKIQQMNAKVSENEISKINTRFLPVVSGTVDTRYNGALPIQIIPGDAFGSPGGESRKVKFGTTYVTATGIDVNMPVYNPADRSDKKAAQIQAQYDRLNIQKCEIDIKVEVTQSYCNLLLAIEKMRLSKINVDNTLAVYQMNVDQEAKGSITRYDLDKSRISYENARSDLSKTQGNYQLALNDLSYRMGIDTDLNYVPADSITGLYTNFSEAFNRNDSSGERLEIRQQKLLIQQSETNIRKERNSYFPTITAYGNLTAQYLNNRYKLFDGNGWYPYNYFGIKASIPIFDGFSKQRTKRGYELQMRSAQHTVDKLARDYKYEVLNAKTAVGNDQKEMNNQRNNLNNAMTLYLIDKDRLKQGTIKPTDLSATHYLFLQTQNNYLTAVYTFLIDMVQYEKAAGSL